MFRISNWFCTCKILLQIWHNTWSLVCWISRQNYINTGCGFPGLDCFTNLSIWNLYDDSSLTICLMSIKWTDWHLCPVTNRHSITRLTVSSFKFSLLAGLHVLSKSKTFGTSDIMCSGLKSCWKAVITHCMRTIRQIYHCRWGRSGSVYCRVATPTFIQLSQKFNNLGDSRMNGTCIFCT